MKRKLHDIYKGQIKINKSWLDSYKDYVPKIVSIIKKGVSSEDKMVRLLINSFHQIALYPT